MADINVERKRMSVWPWILGLIALALLIWALAEMFEGGETTREGVTTEEVGANERPAPARVADLRLT